MAPPPTPPSSPSPGHDATADAIRVAHDAPAALASPSLRRERLPAFALPQTDKKRTNEQHRSRTTPGFPSPEKKDRRTSVDGRPRRRTDGNESRSADDDDDVPPLPTPTSILPTPFSEEEVQFHHWPSATTTAPADAFATQEHADIQMEH